MTSRSSFGKMNSTLGSVVPLAMLLAINKVFWSILRSVRILLTYCNRIVNKIWHHVIIACDSLIWLSVVWVDVPLWSEEAREEWEGQSSVSSKEAWTCHLLSGCEPLILPPELLPSEERNKYRFLLYLSSSGFDLQSDPIFWHTKFPVQLLLWYTRDEEVNVMEAISVTSRSN